ncbi:hypothetical protein Acr_08g0019300 [Actinidia rufa]|uniref:Uncharacterized protein n=1 Tax=Actinidia rufa TaxID=165716 RepID=A0A7J0F4D3_9ERIC|nr:hypothetical protein Acr_08g0019300 [Actinidia rufa]
MEEDEEDPYASILEACKRSPCEGLGLTLTNDETESSIVPLPHPLTTQYCRLVDHAAERDGTIILPESIDDYLCHTPEASQHDDHHYTDACMEAHHTPPCVVSYQISSPPSLDLSLPNSQDATNDADSEAHQKQSDSLWLSQLKSLARLELEGFFDHAVSIVTRFRDSKYRLSLSWSPSPSPSPSNLGDKLVGSSPKSRNQAPLKRSKRQYIDVVRSKSCSEKRILGPSSKSKRKNVTGESPFKKHKHRDNNFKSLVASTDADQADSLWLSQLKSMARQEGVFDHAISIITGFRASQYRHSLSPSPMEILDLGPSSKPKRKNVSNRSPLKKHKHCQNNLALQSSKNKMGGGLDETGGVSAIVLSDSDEENHCRVIGTLKGVSFKEPGRLRDDVGGSSRNTENHDKSKGVRSSVGANSSVAGQLKRAASTSKATISLAVSGAVGNN